MKLAYKGYIYESVYQTDMFLNDADAEKKYHLDQLDKQRRERFDTQDFVDYEEEIENTEEHIPEILSNWGVSYTEPLTDTYVIKSGNDYNIVVNRNVYSFDSLCEDTDFIRKVFPQMVDLDAKNNQDFWDSPSTLYHATDCDNVDSILSDGLQGGPGTGLGNRSISGIFTSTDAEGYIDSYGDCKIVINTNKMKADGFTPEAFMEPEVVEHEYKSALANMLDIDVEFDMDNSIDYSTIILNVNKIPPKYLSKLEN